METVRTTAQVSEANAWVLVLTAAGIPHRLETTEGGWTLLVPPSEVLRAREALETSDDGFPDEDSTAPAAAAAGPAWILGLAMAALLLGFFAVTGPWRADSAWFGRGAARAGRMLHGEPWRAVTALTLHADAMHAVSNAIATALLLPAIAQPLGLGGGLALALVAGAGANLVTATIHPPSHAAVGASTGTFAMIGILAALQLRAKVTRRSRRRWVVPIATLLLLAMLGTGPRADILAHALGLLAGGGLGYFAAGVRRPLTAPMQWVLVVGAALIVVGCWHIALSQARG